LKFLIAHLEIIIILDEFLFFTSHAIVIIHSFSPTNEWFEDFAKFVSLFGAIPKINSVVSAELPNGMPLHFAWIHGNEEYLKK